MHDAKLSVLVVVHGIAKKTLNILELEMTAGQQ